MNVPLDRRREGFVDEAVSAGRCPSADAVIEAGPRLQQEAARRDLRDHIQAAIAQGGEVTEEELDRALAEQAAELRRQGMAD